MASLSLCCLEVKREGPLLLKVIPISHGMTVLEGEPEHTPVGRRRLMKHSGLTETFITVTFDCMQDLFKEL